MSNPLSQFFRQPKVFISLPSKGVFCVPGTVQGDITNLPVYSLTGMDEIIIKTPDALMSGESTVKILQSCCPAIKDAWNLSTIDISLILAAIRIASYGPTMTLVSKCLKCETENEYDVDLSIIIDHYAKLEYQNKLVLKEITVYVRPVTYKESTEFALKTYQLRQQMYQSEDIKDPVEKQNTINKLFRELAIIQNEMMLAGVESVQTGNITVNEKAYINEWLTNCDNEYISAIKDHAAKILNDWAVPTVPIKCSSCDHEANLLIDLDYSSFFVKA